MEEKKSTFNQNPVKENPTFRQNFLKDIQENAVTSLYKSCKAYVYQKPATLAGTFLLGFLLTKYYVRPRVEVMKDYLEDIAVEGLQEFLVKNAARAREEAGNLKTDA